MSTNVSRSIYLLDWDEKCGDVAFNNWQQHIRAELREMYYKNNPKVQRGRSLEEQMNDAKGQVITLQLAKRILRNGN